MIMRVYPVTGRTVRDPITRLTVPDDGFAVGDYDAFWQRRLRDGDVSLQAPADRAPHGEDAAS